MKLTVWNFRCYRGENIFHINDSGITLINGQSGNGKSTIVMAIYFVITGSAPSKVVSDGETSCKVELERNDTKITRTKTPNRVIVQFGNRIIEDDEAEQYIIQQWGKNFEITSYIQQQYNRSFLYQSPTEKLSILEQLCFGDDESSPEKLKRKCMEMYKNLSSEQSFLQGQLNSLSKLLEPIEKPHTVLKPDENELSKLKTQLKQYKIREQKYIGNIAAASKLMEYKNIIFENTKLLQKLPIIQYSLEELKINLVHHQQLAIIPTQTTVWEKYSRTECEEIIKDYSTDISLHKEYLELSTKIVDIQSVQDSLSKLENEKTDLLHISEGEFECPYCENQVQLVNNSLVKIGQKKSENISPHQKKENLAILEEKIQEKRDILSVKLHLRERLTQLEERIDTTELISKLQSDFDWINTYYKNNLELEKRNQIYQDQRNSILSKVLKDVSETETTELIKISKTKQQYEKEIKECTEWIYTHPIEQIDDVSIQIQELEKQIEIFNQNIHSFNIFELHNAKYLKFIQTENEYCEINKKLQKVQRKMIDVMELKQLILKTESDIISSRVQKISELVNQYSSNIFIEPITVQLQMTKKTKTQNDKVQVQLEVFYKNMKCDVSILSGGEQARLNLAFVLAFAKVFHSPILILDECTSNLDSEMTEMVLEQINNSEIPKVIIIAHQIVEGNFQQIIQV